MKDFKKWIHDNPDSLEWIFGKVKEERFITVKERFEVHVALREVNEDFRYVSTDAYGHTENGYRPISFDDEKHLLKNEKVQEAIKELEAKI